MSRSLGKITLFRRARIRILIYSNNISKNPIPRYIKKLFYPYKCYNSFIQTTNIYLNIKIMYSIRTKVFLKVYEGYSQKGKQLPHSVC